MPSSNINKRANNFNTRSQNLSPTHDAQNSTQKLNIAVSLHSPWQSFHASLISLSEVLVRRLLAILAFRPPLRSIAYRSHSLTTVSTSARVTLFSSLLRRTDAKIVYKNDPAESKRETPKKELGKAEKHCEELGNGLTLNAPTCTDMFICHLLRCDYLQRYNYHPSFY
jgi:hypothetical protein